MRAAPSMVAWPYELLREAADLIDSLLSERDWQPIETAPKDGTEFIGGNYGRHGDNWFVKILRWEPEHQWGAAFCDGYGRADPTHWMPLYEPPARAMRGKRTTRLDDMKIGDEVEWKDGAP